MQLNIACIIKFKTNAQNEKKNRPKNVHTNVKNVVF